MDDGREMCIDPALEKPQTTTDLTAMLEGYRRRERSLPSYEELQHVAAEMESLKRQLSGIVRPPLAVYYDMSTDYFRGASDDCALDNNFQVHWRHFKGIFPQSREDALEAFTAEQLRCGK